MSCSLGVKVSMSLILLGLSDGVFVLVSISHKECAPTRSGSCFLCFVVTSFCVSVGHVTCWLRCALDAPLAALLCALWVFWVWVCVGNRPRELLGLSPT